MFDTAPTLKGTMNATIAAIVSLIISLEKKREKGMGKYAELRQPAARPPAKNEVRYTAQSNVESLSRKGWQAST